MSEPKPLSFRGQRPVASLPALNLRSTARATSTSAAGLATLNSQRSTSGRGFTLLELLVVIVLIAALSVAFIGGIGQSRSVALQAGQSAVSNLIAAARSRAMANGNPTRLLVNQQLPSPSAPAPVPPRYLRYLALQEQINVAGKLTWTTVADAYLPDGVYVLPNTAPALPFFIPPDSWVTIRRTSLQSLALTAGTFTSQVNSNDNELWAAFYFSTDGRPVYTLSADGQTVITEPALAPGDSHGIVLTVGRALPPGGASPFVFENAENVRGLVLGNYGVPVLVNDRSGF